MWKVVVAPPDHPRSRRRPLGQYGPSTGSSGGDGSGGVATTSSGSGTEKKKGWREKRKEKEKEKGIEKEGSEESIRKEIQRLQCLLPPPSGVNPGPAPNLGPSPASHSEREHSKGEVHVRTDTFSNEKLEVRSFLMQAFGPHVDPFLDIQVPRLDAPFVYDANGHNPVVGEAKDLGSRSVLTDAEGRD
jgi:hypothetical protein